MDIDGLVREWFYELPKGYADAPYTKTELDILDEVLAKHGISLNEFSRSSDRDEIERFVMSNPKFEDKSPRELDQLIDELEDEWDNVHDNYKNIDDYFEELEKTGGLENLTEVDQLDQAFNDAKPVNIREALITIGGKKYQLNKSEVDKITGYLEKDMNKKDFSPMSRQVKTATGRLVTKPNREIGKFAEEDHWQEWLDTVEGKISPEKLQKLYFTLYDIASATYTARYIDEVVDEIYNIPANELETHLFSLAQLPTTGGDKGYKIPESFAGIADIGTARGGSKGTEMGRGEFIIPLMFDRGELGGANATHDVSINGDPWHVKELITNKNEYIRLGMTTFATSELANVMRKDVGMGTKEFNVKRVLPALSKPIKSGKMSIIESLDNVYGNVNNESEAMMKIQEELDREMRLKGIAHADGKGVIFYVSDERTMYFVPTDECICGGATQGAHSVGMSYSGRPVGRFASAAEGLN
jgi:hypothetical protein